MESMAELTSYVSGKAKLYLEETGTKIEQFPISIVDFVIEEFLNKCNFQDHHTEKEIVSILEKKKSAMVQACSEVYGKVGGEGELSHAENGTSRVYESSWISPKLFDGLPNYVGVPF